MTCPFQNLYSARLTTQERPCFVCSKFINVVLISADNSNDDWFYVCRSHLGDTHFCTKLGGKPVQPQSPLTKKHTLEDRKPEGDTVSDLVESISTAWKSWRDTKKESPQDTAEKNTAEKNTKDTAEKDTKDTAETREPSPTASPKEKTSTPEKDVPIRFVLQKDYFYLRQREYTKKKQKQKAEEAFKALSFPKVPTVRPGSSS
ncbi:VPS4-associated protein 1 [Spinellus fusiger]|nr:VPS4-associated protein 1 [Spinellus fusiger]